MPDTRTARDLVTASLKRLGVIAGIETPSADLLVDGLDRLSDVLATWSTESLVVYGQATIEPTYPLALRDPYVVGPVGDIVVDPRPPWLDQVTVVQGAPGAPFETVLTPLTRAQFDRETSKFQTSPVPSACWYNATWPTADLHLWPVLGAGGLVQRLVLYVPFPIVQGLTPPPLSPDTVLSMPQGYYRVLRDTLALELAPELGRTVDPVIVKITVDGKAQLERVNFEPRTLALPAALPGGACGGGHYDWRGDQVR